MSLEIDGGDWKPGDARPTQLTPEPAGVFRPGMHTRWRVGAWHWETWALWALQAVWAAFLVWWVLGRAAHAEAPVAPPEGPAFRMPDWVVKVPAVPDPPKDCMLLWTGLFTNGTIDGPVIEPGVGTLGYPILVIESGVHLPSPLKIQICDGKVRISKP